MKSVLLTEKQCDFIRDRIQYFLNELSESNPVDLVFIKKANDILTEIEVAPSLPLPSASRLPAEPEFKPTHHCTLPGNRVLPCELLREFPEAGRHLVEYRTNLKQTKPFRATFEYFDSVYTPIEPVTPAEAETPEESAIIDTEQFRIHSDGSDMFDSSMSKVAEAAPAAEPERKSSKPISPLGVFPEYLWRQHRIDELKRSITEYVDFGRLDLVPEWTAELGRHIEWMKEHNEAKSNDQT